MPTRYLVVGLGAWVLALAVAHPASALSTSECSAKYKAAKAANTLGGKSWNDFRKTECGTTAPASAPATKAAKPSPAPTGSAVFPAKVDPKYSTLSAGKGRQKTCLDQYNANKASGGNGGLKWIQKGGGYYSECNKRLKG